MSPKPLFASLLLLAAVPSFASDTDLDVLVRETARERLPMETILWGRPVRAVPYGAGDDCQRVGLIHLDNRMRDGSERIDNFKVCGTSITRIDDLPPSLPNDPQFKQVTRMAMVGAARYGRRGATAQGYLISSTRLGMADGRGCAQVETTVTYEGLLVAHSAGTVCP
jgi:hypothetical protein